MFVIGKLGEAMAATKERLLNQIDLMLADGRSTAARKYASTNVSLVPAEDFQRFRGGCLNIVRMLGEPGETWKLMFESDKNYAALHLGMVGALTAIRDAIVNDLLFTVESLVLAEEFGNLLEQADHLFANNYFLAAGVLGRAVLEDHLRTWCNRTSCVPAKAQPTLNDYNQALYGAQHITKLVMKHLESMIAVGNDAAHNAPTLKKEDVDRLLHGVKDFLIQKPLP
jgi:hypothetical protein